MQNHLLQLLMKARITEITSPLQWQMLGPPTSRLYTSKCNACAKLETC